MNLNINNLEEKQERVLCLLTTADILNDLK